MGRDQVQGAMGLASTVLVALLAVLAPFPAIGAEIVSQSYALPAGGGYPHDLRSEERRVGKECRL